MCTAAFHKPLFCTICSPLNQNSLPFSKCSGFFAEIFMRNMQFLSCGMHIAFLKCSLPFKMSRPPFKKALLLNNMQRSAVFHPNRAALPFKIKTTNYNGTFKTWIQCGLSLNIYLFLLEGQYFRRCTVFPMNALWFEMPDYIYFF